MSDEPMDESPRTDDLTPLDVLPEPEPELAAPEGGRRLFAIVLSAIGIVAAGVFAFAYLAPDDNTPEEAVRELAEAISNEDLLGVLDTLAPSERDPLRDEVIAITDELRRLELLDKDTDLSAVDGIDIEITDLELAATPLGDGVTVVDVRATARFGLEPQSLPLGSFAEEQAGDDLPGAESTSQPIDDLKVVTIKEGGRWYVSLFYSVAEAARRDAGAPVPDFGNGVEPDGAGSPEDAVRALVDAGVELDLRRAIALLPPDEGRVLHDYAPLFLEDAEKALAEERKSFAAKVTRLDLSTARDGDVATVKVDGFAASATTDDGAMSVEFDGRCATITVDGDEERTCADETPDGALFGPFSGLFSGRTATSVAILTVERDGEWYISPARTVLHPITEALRAIEREDIERLFDGFEDFFGAGLRSERASSIATETAEAVAPAPRMAAFDSSDRGVQSRLRNALVAFKIGAIEAGAWPDEPARLLEIEPGIAVLPYENWIPGIAVVFMVDGSTVHLASRGDSGCFYLRAELDGPVSYAADAACGPPGEQSYSDGAWG